MSAPDRTTLLRAGLRFPDPSAVLNFVGELEKNWPNGQQAQSDNENSLTVNTLYIGTRLRLQATADGGTLDVLGLDNVWHTQQAFAQKGGIKV